MDVFLEYLVPKKKETKEKLIIAAIIAGGVILSLLLMGSMLLLALNALSKGKNVGSMTFSIGLLLIALVWYCAYLLINMQNLEYEYIVTNSAVDIDKVLSKKGRKHLVDFDITSATVMARTDDTEHNAMFLNPPQNVRVLDYSAKSPNAYTYFTDCEIEEKRTIVVWQPTQKMVDALWKFNPRAIVKY